LIDTGLFGCGSAVSLCDLTWQVTLRSSV